MTKVLLLCFVFSLFPALNWTYQWSNNAHGLSILATMEDNKHSMNPYVRDGYLITPKVALWLLLNFDYPYGRCSPALLGCETPIIHFVGASLDSNGSDSIVERRYEILHHLIARGENIGSRHKGLTPLHESILFCNSRYAKILIAAGVDIRAKINKPDSKMHEMSAVEFAEYIYNSKYRSCTTINDIFRVDET